MNSTQLSNAFAANLMQDKVVLVTGGSGCLGSTICQKFASLGAKVAIHYHANKEKATNVLSTVLSAGSEGEIFMADLEKADSCAELIERVSEKFGKIDIIINNAVVFKVSAFEDIDPEDFHKQLNVNVLAPIILSQTALKYFPKEGGSIVNIASVNSFLPSVEAAIYSASKAALVNLTTSMGRLLATRKIRVNAISPGAIEGENVANIPLEMRKIFTDKTPLAPRFADPEEIANMAIFLSSPASTWITGKNYTVDGGYCDF